jgi:hypothetical protein
MSMRNHRQHDQAISDSIRAALIGVVAMLLLWGFSALVSAAEYRTDNFSVSAPSSELARAVGEAAEHYRDELATAWLGQTIPTWHQPCSVTVRIQNGAGGATSFAFDRGHVFGWNMTLQGQPQEILDSVLPHEITHTILASHFRRPTPRWASEGASTLAESESDRQRMYQCLKQSFDGRHVVSLRHLFEIREYPNNSDAMLALYSQGFAVTDYLVERNGKSAFLAFLDVAHQHGWETAAQGLGFSSVLDLQRQWVDWLKAERHTAMQYRRGRGGAVGVGVGVSVGGWTRPDG